jgi:8-oxo-dGTP pyrophosphatase MutT (NUDIX family)
MPTSGATVRALEDQLRDRLRHPLPGKDAQLRFAPRPGLKSWDPAARPDDARTAAALLLIYPGSEGPTVVLTQRHADLPHHGGQISLPGGGLHAGEIPPDAALREAHEEIGLDPTNVRVIGSLSTLWVIVSRFVVHPIVAVADSRPDFVPCAREVASLIEAPLNTLWDPARLKFESRVRRGADGNPGLTVSVPYFDVDGHQVWGATAMILGELGVALNPSFGPR